MERLCLWGVMFLVTLISTVCGAGSAPLTRSTPEAEGIPSEAIIALIRELDEEIDAMNSLMILRHGKVIAECWWAPHSAETSHALYSLTKSFTSVAIGFAVAEGKLSLDDKVIDFFPDEVPENPSENLKKMTVRSLLTMSCGHEEEVKYTTEGEWSDADWIKTFLVHPVVHEPGTHFFYNTPGSHLLSIILTRATGKSLADWLKTRLFEPLGIDNFSWESTPGGFTEGGAGLWLRTEEIAKFGEFLLRKGEWNGRELLSPAWFDEAASKQVSNGDDPDYDWNQGYGYQFWMCRFGAFRGDGMFGQFCVVIPEKDMVIVSTADTIYTKETLNLYWKHLLPAAGKDPLPDNPEARKELHRTEAELLSKPGASPSCILRDRKIDSGILGHDVLYNVYLPKGYLTFGGPWKTLYLLHGASDDRNTWLAPEQERLEEYADRFFSDNPDAKRIIVVPDRRLTRFRNGKGKEERYEDFVAEELIPEIEKMFHAADGRENRAVAGLSMGGYGALLWTLRHPELFSRCYAISAAVRNDDKHRTEGQPLSNIIFDLAAGFPEESKAETRFFLDCGDDDALLYFNVDLYRLMKEKGIEAELRVRNGGHNRDYFSAALPEVFEFLGRE